MSNFLNWMLVISYFSVFLLGLLACFHVTREYFKTRKFLKGSSVCALALSAIGGLVQAIIGA